MYLVLVNSEAANVRASYALTPCADKYFPKKGERSATLDGELISVRITGSRNYATPDTAGNNAYLQLDGKTFWLSFDSGFNAREAELVFTLHAGKAPDSNPIREPKNPAGEILRRQNLSASLKAKFSTPAGILAPVTTETA